MLTAAPTRNPLAAAASRKVCASAMTASDKARSSNANQFIRRSMGEPPFELLPPQPSQPPQPPQLQRMLQSGSLLTFSVSAVAAVARPLHSSEEPEEPRREAVEIDKDVVRVGVGQTEPAGQRIAVLIH